MSFLYLTADRISEKSGGGLVTNHESIALSELGDCEVWDRTYLDKVCKYYLTREEPWIWDNSAHAWLQEPRYAFPDLVHCYAGTFSSTITALKEKGVVTTYTAAAHNVTLSRQEHEKLGIGFNYEHLTNPVLWNRYVKGYLDADVVICPSQHSKQCMESYGCKNVVVIPHGVDLPDKVTPLPKRFTVGYLGSCGSPDKGLIYLLQAWKQLAYKDATLLLAGRDSTSPWVRHLIERFGGGNIECIGWVDNVADFYNRVSVYVQPSVTEGFGIEVLEAQAFSRFVLCSDGVGACDLVHEKWQYPSTNVVALCEKLEQVRAFDGFKAKCELNREQAKHFTWPKIRERYKEVWRSLL